MLTLSDRQSLALRHHYADKTFTDRYERRATVVTSNLAFAEWVTVFAGDEKLTTALLDRLAHHATVLTTKGKSYRMRKRRTREEPPS
jgi:DNA replication protein DnaC